MKKFRYVIKDEVGIHARPAGLLVNKAKALGNTITLTCNGKSADCTKILMIMSLGAKKGMEVEVKVEGETEEVAVKELEMFFKENL